MKARTKLVTLLALPALSIGCAHSEWLATNPPPHPMPPRDPEQVEMFTSGEPSRPWVEVGLIQGSGQVSDLRVLKQVRKEAGERGCDGLIVNGETKSAGITGSGAFVTAQEYTSFRAACIVYK